MPEDSGAPVSSAAAEPVIPPDAPPAAPGGSPPANPTVLTITPDSVSLNPAQSQLFVIDPPGQRVTWQLVTNEKRRDGFHTEGYYQAPRWTVRTRSVFFLARSADENVKPAAARIELSASSFWSAVIGLFWLLTAGFLVWGMLTIWPKLRSFAPLSAVNPSVVTLKAKDTQQFDVTGPEAASNLTSVAWSLSPNVGTISTGGLYRAPDDAPDQAVTLSGVVEGKTAGSATIFLRKKTLTISPSSTLLRPLGKQTFTVVPTEPATNLANAEATPAAAPPAAKPAEASSPCGVSGWSVVPPSLGKVDEKGSYEAPATVSQPQRVSVIVSNQCDSAAASVYLSNDPQDFGFGYLTRLLILFVMIMGALGSYIHAASSFVAFAGNRQFSSSWTWWYFLRAPIGSALAVIGYFLLAGGYISAAGTDTGNLVKIGVISGLIGLYEEQACVKIGEIFDALFKPADKGRDPLETNKAVILAPVVTDVQQTGRTIMVVGTGFVKDCSKVLINGTPAKTTEFVSTTQLRAGLNDTDKGEVSITVSNHSADGKDSTSAAVKKTLSP